MTKEKQIPPISVFVGFHMPIDLDEQVRLYAYIHKVSISKAYRLIIQEGMKGTPTKEEAIRNIVERLKLDWKVASYDNPNITRKSFCIMKGSKMKGKLSDPLVNEIMNRLVNSFDFAKDGTDQGKTS